ncbi:hypothetical protein [Nocardia sp. bgisy134]|uniref:hypothetical protein n=1 Tax=Nocardia sp. bgisy134 TaxID=3413789 RepID=UPI003D70F5C0
MNIGMERNCNGSVDDYETSQACVDDAQHNTEVQYDVEAGLKQLRRRLGFHYQPENLWAGPARNANGRTVESVPTVAADTPRESADSRRREVVERIEGLIITPLKISSVISPEVAVRLGDGNNGERWALSWLPKTVLTRRQAISAMVIDEILADPKELDSAAIISILRELSEDLGMSLENMLLKLSSIKTDCYPRMPRNGVSRQSLSLTVDAESEIAQ